MTSRGGQGTGAAMPRRLSGRSPKGEQLRSILEDLIGTLRPGDPLPSERELAERYDVARMTVRSEITRLAAEGLVERVQGRGTFVAEPRVAQAAALSSFTEDMRARGLTAGSRVLGQETVPADAVVSRGLEIDPGTPVVRLRRVRTADGDPMALEEAFLDAARFPDLAETSLEGASLFDVLENRFGVRFPTANQRVVAVEIVGEDANLLRVAPGRAGLKFHTILLDESERPLAYAWSLFRGDRYEIRLRQERRT
ncbi:MAG TPA: GntR family transcriptional regulator [Baekduia sp.]|uniref:GntR family transcriptional regulator n=1 Tax=Baekduia sp. TaxID=2600305 RepID=UPI002B69F5BC|nr:GntR family transcriptional regulator [Baekduia sp.]HMJ34561.1 GntR family transcriptional regulator [Baekduia sp.]